MWQPLISVWVLSPFANITYLNEAKVKRFAQYSPWFQSLLMVLHSVVQTKCGGSRDRNPNLCSVSHLLAGLSLYVKFVCWIFHFTQKSQKLLSQLFILKKKLSSSCSTLEATQYIIWQELFPGRLLIKWAPHHNCIASQPWMYDSGWL